MPSSQSEFPNVAVAEVLRLGLDVEVDLDADGRRGLRDDLGERRDLADLLGHQRVVNPIGCPAAASSDLAWLTFCARWATLVSVEAKPDQNGLSLPMSA